MTVKTITAKQAYDLIEQDNNHILIDVRTDAEWEEIGVPLIKNGELILLSWLLSPNMEINNIFTQEIMAKAPDPNQTLFFICRSGGRSAKAASLCISLGYKNCYNIIDGFEGDGKMTGWKHSNLPWQVL